MSTLAILPVKSLGAAKQRLDGALEPGPRRALAEAMLCDVLVALRRTRGVHGTIVITRDPTAAQIAGGYGATVLGDDEQGHSAAALRGIDHATEQGARRVLLVPGDCPILDPGELDDLLAQADAEARKDPAGGPGASVVVVPDRHGTGTNALVLRPPAAIAPSFGEGSCARHLHSARAGGAGARVAEVPSLALDIDTGEDLQRLRETLAATRGGAAQTRGMLSQLTRSQSG